MTSARPRQKQPDKYFIAVARKIFDLLEYFIQEGSKQEAISFQQLSNALPFARTTAHRLIYTLEKMGYIEKADGKGQYRLGAKFFELTGPAVHFRQLQSVARSVMTELMIRHGETVNLAVLDEGQVDYIEVLQSPSALRIAANPGQRNPGHSTAVGKVMMAYLPEKELAAILRSRPLIKMTPKTITQRAHFLEHLASVRERGVAFDLGENLEGVVCVAAPIFDQHGRIVAGLSISGPANRMSSKLKGIEEEIREAGSVISRMLGLRTLRYGSATAEPPVPHVTSRGGTLRKPKKAG
jgi:DNA-binding IclR family transcriptional regulator